MSSRVVSVRSDETVAKAVERMTRYGFSAVPVVTSTFRLVGMVSLLDVIRYRELHAEEGLEADDDIPVAEIMNEEVLSLPVTANVASVAQRLASNGQLRVVPIVQGGKLVGIVTRTDLLRGSSAVPKQTGLGRFLGGGNREDAEDQALFSLARQRRIGDPPPSEAAVRDVMTTPVLTVAPTDPVALAGRLMLRDRHTSLPVVDANGVLVGVISEADILADPYAGRHVHATVAGVMTDRPLSIDVGATVGEARTMVADRGLRIVPVVDGGVLVGVLSRSDLV